MTKFSAFLGMALMTLLFVSCGDDAIFQGDSGKGKVSLLLDINTSITASRAASSMSEAPTVHDLTIKITPQDGSHAPYEYGYDEFLKADPNYPIGEYLLEVYCGDAEAEGFNLPHYYGSAVFEIKPDKTTEVAITASMSKAMFTILYTDAVKDYLRSYSATLQSQGGTPMAYLGSETRPIYLKAGVVSIFINIEKQTGAASQIKVGDVNAERAHHYKITVDLNANEDVSAGEGALTIEFDELLHKEDVEVDLRDHLVNAAPPTVTPAGFENGVAIEHFIGEKLVPESYLFNLTALAGFKEVNVTTINPKAISENWPESINLLGNLSDSQKSAFEAMGLKVTGLWTPVIGEIASVDFTGVVEKMLIPDGGSNQVQITVTVVDDQNKTNGEPVSMAVALTQPKIVLEQVKNTLEYGEGQAEFDIEYNGPSAESLIYTVGTQQKTPTLTKTPDGKWHGVIDVPFAGDAKLTVHNDVEPANGGYVQQSISYTRTDADYTSSWIDVENSGDVWATKVTLPCPTGISAPVFLKGSNGKSFGMYPTSLVDGKYPITGFTPATENYVLVCDDADHNKAGICYKFTTEAAVQLPNSGMESWYSDKKANGDDVSGSGLLGSSNWDHWYPQDKNDESTWGWDTMNYLTTSPGATWGGNTKYNTLSATIPTAGHTGSRSALIRTVGWGIGTTAGGSTVKHVTAGQLYLGNYSEPTPNYGRDFNSRPKSLSFWYKFSAAKNDDYGLAQIRVLDSKGEVIGEGSFNPTSQSTWKEQTVEVVYNANAPKASKIEVTFISSVHPTYSNSKSGLNFSSNGHVGAQLYIDDITLIYEY